MLRQYVAKHDGNGLSGQRAIPLRGHNRGASAVDAYTTQAILKKVRQGHHHEARVLVTKDGKMFTLTETRSIQRAISVSNVLVFDRR